MVGMEKSGIKLAPFVAMLTAVALVGFAGCSQAPESQSDGSENEVEAVDAVAVPDLTIGVPSQGSVKLLIENNLGASITALSYADSAEGSVPTVLFADEAVWKSGELAEVYIPAGSAAQRNLILEVDGQEYTLHDLDVTVLGEFSFEWSAADQLPYASYVLNGKEATTLAHEKELQARAAEQSAAEAEEKAAAESAANQQQTWGEPASSNGYQENSAPGQNQNQGYQQSNAGSGSEAVGGQTEERCIEGGVKLR